VRDLEQAFSDMLSIQGSQIRKERESSARTVDGLETTSDDEHEVSSDSRPSTAHSQLSQDVNEKEMDLLEIERDARDIARILSAKSPNFGQNLQQDMKEALMMMDGRVRSRANSGLSQHHTTTEEEASDSASREKARLKEQKKAFYEKLKQKKSREGKDRKGGDEKQKSKSKSKHNDGAEKATDDPSALNADAKQERDQSSDDEDTETEIVDGGEGGDSIDTDLLPQSGQVLAEDIKNADATEIRGVEQEETHDKEKKLTEEEKASQTQVNFFSLS
jgi:hypothetical protein